MLLPLSLLGADAQPDRLVDTGRCSLPVQAELA